ncbi:MAG: polyhydroxyalkanoate synthesis repressor PhaR [Woeseiaceae bacterium]|nr:polyhydroxyalkanoate synthesis repressor PhaR [Woeseiaceae bacterium]
MGYRRLMKCTRIITKYPNRRLYDTVESRYVTLADIKNLVTEKIEFLVRDRKSGEDITRSILLQVITEQEQRGMSVMSRDFLSEVIRSYDKAIPEFASDYLEESMEFFMAQQQNLRRQICRVAGIDPFAAVADVAQKNIARWKSLQDEVLRRFSEVSLLDDSHADDLSAEHKQT